MNNRQTIIKILGVFLCLYLFLVGIGGLSSGIKGLGGDFAKTVLTATSNPFVALFIGILCTTLFQSSSTTTSIIVTMASTGALSIGGAVPMIMGANIGTTVTNTIVSIGYIGKGNEFRRAFAASTVHDFFNIMAVLILFPLEIMFGFLEKLATGLGTILFGVLSTDQAFKSPIKKAVKWGSKQLEQLSFNNEIIYIIISVLLTFLMLYCIVKLLRSLVLEKVEAFFDKYLFRNAITALLFGIILTIMVQSSSITTSTIVPLAGAGVLTLRQIFPFTLGANIGTTVTALLASLTLNPIAMVAAFSHLFFNIFAIVIIYPIKILREIPIKLAEFMAEQSVKNKFIPLIYLFILFVGLPLSIIFMGG